LGLPSNAPAIGTKRQRRSQDWERVRFRCRIGVICWWTRAESCPISRCRL